MTQPNADEQTAELRAEFTRLLAALPPRQPCPDDGRFRITFRKTIHDPAERAVRLARLYSVFERRETIK